MTFKKKPSRKTKELTVVGFLLGKCQGGRGKGQRAGRRGGGAKRELAGAAAPTVGGSGGKAPVRGRGEGCRGGGGGREGLEGRVGVFDGAREGTSEKEEVE